MKFVNMRELSRSLSKYVKQANDDDSIIITKNGHPYAILQRFEEEDMDDYILAKNFDLESEFELAREEHKAGKTVNIHDLKKALK